MKTLIKGGTVVTAIDTVKADVLIDGEKVVAVLAPGSHDFETTADTVIDATGKLVTPGSIDRKSVV